MDDVAILIPVYEPEAGFAEFVERLRGEFAHVVVVDDGSTTGRDALASVRGRVDALLVHEANRGKGAALKTGFAWILGNLPQVRGVVTVDADGQHLPKDVRRVAEALRASPGGIVLGVRAFAGEVPFRSRFGNFWTRALFRLLTGVPVRDTQTGLRGIPRGLLDWALALPGDRYEYETWMLVGACRLAAEPVQVDIETVYAAGNGSSHYRPFRDSLLTQRALFAAVFGAPAGRGGGNG